MSVDAPVTYALPVDEERRRVSQFPEVEFRDGPAGRRASLREGNDIWQLVEAIRLLQADEPDLSQEDAVVVVADAVGASTQHVRTAVQYAAAYPHEIEAWLVANREAEDWVSQAVPGQRDRVTRSDSSSTSTSHPNSPPSFASTASTQSPSTT